MLFYLQQKIMFPRSYLRPIHTFHAAPMPFPCRAVPLRVYNVSFPFDLHSTAVSDSHLPSHTHAMLRPCRSSPGHGTARPSRDGLWATCPRSASSSYRTEFHEGCYQKHQSQMQVASVKPNNICHGRGKEW